MNTPISITSVLRMYVALNEIMKISETTGLDVFCPSRGLKLSSHQNKLSREHHSTGYLFKGAPLQEHTKMTTSSRAKLWLSNTYNVKGATIPHSSNNCRYRFGMRRCTHRFYNCVGMLLVIPQSHASVLR